MDIWRKDTKTGLWTSAPRPYTKHDPIERMLIKSLAESEAELRRPRLDLVGKSCA